MEWPTTNYNIKCNSIFKYKLGRQLGTSNITCPFFRKERRKNNVARKRMIDPNIWQSEDFSKLSTLGKLVFIGLFSLADDEGRGRCNPVYLKSTLNFIGISLTVICKRRNSNTCLFCCNLSHYTNA